MNDVDDDGEPVRAAHMPCPACSAPVESLSHFLFDCSRTADFRSQMYEGLRGGSGCAETLRDCLAISDQHVKVCRFVSCDFWGGRDVLAFVVPLITSYLQKAWRLRNQCKHGSDVVDHAAFEAQVGSWCVADGSSAMAQMECLLLLG
jgi:hypothetical protein